MISIKLHVSSFLDPTSWQQCLTWSSVTFQVRWHSDVSTISSSHMIFLRIDMVVCDTSREMVAHLKRNSGVSTASSSHTLFWSIQHLPCCISYPHHNTHWSKINIFSNFRSIVLSTESSTESWPTLKTLLHLINTVQFDQPWCTQAQNRDYIGAGIIDYSYCTLH